MLRLHRGDSLIKINFILIGIGLRLDKSFIVLSYVKFIIGEMELQVILPGHGGPLTPQQIRQRVERDT